MPASAHDSKLSPCLVLCCASHCHCPSHPPPLAPQHPPLPARVFLLQLYLHSHKPAAVLHRDLKSPNLFVTNTLTVKVGDFNLSRYMSLGASFVKSTLENNPRWNAPEVIGEGYYRWGSVC